MEASLLHSVRSYNLFLLGLFNPAPSLKTKYSTNVTKGYTNQSFANYRLPPSIVTAIVNAANLSLARTTWSSYNTAENHIKRCEQDLKIKIRFPMGPGMILSYIGWLIEYRNVSSSTISQYLSGLRVVHLKHGVFPPNLRPDIVKAILKGRTNSDMSKSKPPGRASAMRVPTFSVPHFASSS